jgi:ribulose-phosphate 3-epimerase
LNPGTAAAVVEPVLHLADIVLVMSVNPGFSGQTFLPEVLPKIKKIRRWLDDKNPEAMIEIDGGMTVDTLPLALSAGVSIFVTATTIFKHPLGIAEGVRLLRSCLPG